jgi:hypothetical protein
MHVRVILVRAKHIMEAEQLHGWIRHAIRIGQGLVLAGYQYLFHNMTVYSAFQWVNPPCPGRAPVVIEGDGTAAQISANKHRWEEATISFKTYNTVQSALKKQIITVVEPMYLEIFNDDLVGFVSTTSRDMLDHLFLSYGSITAVDIEQNFENMRKAWDSQQPVETLFKQIQDCVDFSEAGGATIGAAQKLSSAYSKIFKSGKCISACRR